MKKKTKLSTKIFIVIFSLMIGSAWFFLIKGVFFPSLSQPDKYDLPHIGLAYESDTIVFYESKDSDYAKLKDTNKVFVFSEQSFTKNDSLVKKLIQDKKTVLVYGYRLNVAELFEPYTTDIPVFEFGSSKEAYFYIYGARYDEEEKRFIPQTLIGNFDKSEYMTYVDSFLGKQKNTVA